MWRLLIQVVTIIGFEETIVLISGGGVLGLLLAWLYFGRPKPKWMAGCVWIPLVVGVAMALKEWDAGHRLIAFMIEGDALSAAQQALFLRQMTDEIVQPVIYAIAVTYFLHVTFRLLSVDRVEVSR